MRNVLIHGRWSKNWSRIVSKNCITYHINKEQRIVFLNEGWYSFAKKNKASYLSSDTVINMPIFQFITDESCRHLYQMLIKRCREKHKALRLSFRCDSPEKRRFMSMEIIPLEKDATAFKSCVVREESRYPVELLDVDVDRSDEFVSICSWCKKVRVDGNNWVEVEEASEQMGLFGAVALPQLSHGMCPMCLENTRKKFFS